MSQHARDLRNAGLYLVVLAIVGTTLVLGGMTLGERAVASSFFSELASFLEPDPDPAPTRLSIAVENAREVQAALAKPVEPPAPLQPITAKLAHGHLKPGSRIAHPHRPKLPRAAMNAMASARPGAETPRPQAMPVQVDLHRAY
jgi:hypothetical protein